MYCQIAEELRDRIYGGELSSTSRLPSEDALRGEFSVSRVTIRGALKKLETEGLVHRVSGKGTFVTGDVLQKQRRILLVLEFAPQYVTHLHQLVMGAIVEAQANSCSVLVCPYDQFRRQAEAAVANPRRQTGALLLRCRNYKPADVRYAEKRGIACVMEGAKPQAGFNWLAVDNAGAIRELVDHLYSLGRRRFGILTVRLPFPWSSMEDRFHGAIRRLQELKIPRRDIKTVRVSSSAGMDSSPYDATKRFFPGKGKPIDALVCGSDKIAVQALRWMSNHGIRVPDDVAVTGFDDTVLARFATPPLTTVQQDYYTSGAEAVRELCSLMDDFDNRRIQKTRKLKLIFRESTLGPADRGKEK